MGRVSKSIEQGLLTLTSGVTNFGLGCHSNRVAVGGDCRPSVGDGTTEAPGESG